MTQRSLFPLLLMLCFTLASASASGQVVKKRVPSKKDEGEIQITPSFLDRSATPAVIYHCVLTLPRAKLKETSRWKNDVPATSAIKAINLAESKLDECQFFPEKIAWTLTDLELASFDTDDNKKLWFWELRFKDPSDMKSDGILARKAIVIAVLLNGTVVVPICYKSEVDNVERFLKERERRLSRPPF